MTSLEAVYLPGLHRREQVVHPQTTPADMPALLTTDHDRIDRFLAIGRYLTSPSMRRTEVGARTGKTLDEPERILPGLPGSGWHQFQQGMPNNDFADGVLGLGIANRQASG